MPIQSVEQWEEKARFAEEAAAAMGIAPARFAMLEIARLYRLLAEQTRKLSEGIPRGSSDPNDAEPATKALYVNSQLPGLTEPPAAFLNRANMSGNVRQVWGGNGSRSGCDGDFGKGEKLPPRRCSGQSIKG